MFKCCVCHGKTSRRTSQEEDDDDSEREMDEEDDDSSSEESSSDDEDEKDDDEEEREIEEELAKKFKCQNANAQEANVAEALVSREQPTEENGVEDRPSAVEEIVVEVNGDVRGLRSEIVEKNVDREAIKEDVVEILNCAVKIVQEIRRGERERLEKIKEESGEDTVEESTTGSPATDDAKIARGEEKKPELEKLESEETEEEVVTVIEEDEGEYEIVDQIKKSKTDLVEEMIMEELINEVNAEADSDQELKEIQPSSQDGSQQQLSELSNEEASIAAVPDKESTSGPAEVDQPPPPPFCEVEIIEEIKKTEIYKMEKDVKEVICTAEQESVEVNIMQGVCPTEAEAIPETISDTVNSDLLNIPPPATPPPEEAAEFERLDEEVRSEPSFPTPPPIDFDVAETTDQEDNDDDEDEMDRRPSSIALSRVGPPVPPWEDEESTPPPPDEQPQRHALEDFLPVLGRQDSKPASPGSKSLPSPPSPGSETGCETEADSKSSSDEQTTKMSIMPCGSKTAYIERTIDDGPDDEGDDSVFEPASLAKDPEIIKDIPPRPVPPVPRWLSQEEDDPESTISESLGGMQEPPATPVARDELAMRRHRFFSDLVQAARNTAEHRVSFDPLGPVVHPGCEHDDREEHLEELVSRLENVTKRLEQVSTAAAAAAAAAVVVAAHPLPPPPQTQEIAVQTKSPSPERSPSLTEDCLPAESSQSSSSSSRESTLSSVASVVEVLKSMSVAGYEDILAGPVREYIQLSKKIGGDVASHCQLVEKAFQIQLHFIKTAASRPAPTQQSEQVSLLGPTSTQIQEIQEFREKHRGSPFFNHLSAISESIPALGWVAVSPTPAPYIKEMNDAGQFYTNRVLKDWKEKDKTHVEWCRAWVKTLTDLQQYVRQQHTTGLVWAKSGAGPAACIPPPPPPCMMPMADPAPAINDDRSALFAEINQGENITRNLKKVTADMQTHKNASLRTGPAPFKAPVVSNNSPVKTTLPANAPIEKPPVFTRDGKKWLVEYHKGNKNLVIDNVEMNNVVYMFRCQDSHLVIKGKINSVVMDSCRKSSVVVDSVVASIEFVNCQSVQMQVLGKVPTISIDKTDGCQMYLNNDTLKVEIISSKSSEMNIMVPVGNGDYTEYPVPEQFKTVITGKGLQTIAVDSLG